MGVAVIMDDYNEIGKTPIWLRFPDGISRLAYIMMAGWIADQQEQDKMCAETSQRCKQCVCPKDRLHESHTVWGRRKGRDVERAVRRAAFEGRLPGERGLPSMPVLFKQEMDRKSRRPPAPLDAHCGVPPKRGTQRPVREGEAGGGRRSPG